VGELGGPSAKALDAQVREASPAQQSKVEGWIGLVDAVLDSLAGS